MLREVFLEFGDKRIRDATTMDEHVWFQVSAVQGDNEIVGVGVPGGLEGALFDRRGRVGGVRACAQRFGIGGTCVCG